MTDQFHAAVDFLYSLQMFGVKLGLGNIRALLAELGDPHTRFPSIHVAGTNGKGSTSSFLSSILRESGCRTGLYTSPHLVDFRERIRIDGVPIPAEAVEEGVDRMRAKIGELRATFFEATTALAFAHFAAEGVDAAVIETGLGGRLDATNVLLPEVSVITGIDLEHTEFLGSTIAEIAAEKGGIIKPDVPVLTAAHQAEALGVLRGIAAEQRAPFMHVRPDAGSMQMHDFDDMEFALTFDGTVLRAHSGLAGTHQATNATLAAAAAGVFAARTGRAVGAQAVLDGLARVRDNSGLHARLERVLSDPELVIDVAHNPAGVQAMLGTWASMRDPQRTHLVFGMLRTKDVSSVADLLIRNEWASITAVSSSAHDARPAGDIVEAFIGRVPGVSAFAAPIDGVRAAIDRCAPGESVLLFGSHYVVGDFLAAGGSAMK